MHLPSVTEHGYIHKDNTNSDGNSVAIYISCEVNMQETTGKNKVEAEVNDEGVVTSITVTSYSLPYTERDAILAEKVKEAYPWFFPKNPSEEQVDV